MPQYLLNIIHPVGEVPPPEDLEPAMRELASLNEEMRAAGAWVFAAALHQPEASTVVVKRASHPSVSAAAATVRIFMLDAGIMSRPALA